MRRRRPSLATAPIAVRLLAAALVIMLISLPLAGVGLAHHFRASATAAFDERLESLLNVVVARLTYDSSTQRLKHDAALGDPRFDQVFSGWYWQVSDGADIRLTSRSLWDQRLPIRAHDTVVTRDLLGPRGTALRIIERDIHLAPLDTPLHVSVAITREELNAALDDFTTRLSASLIGVGVLLLLTLALQVHWGLAPLRRLQADLNAVENGTREMLDTRLPAELARLAGAINGVLARDQRLMERARHAAGNLAHALKTPVSVLSTLAEGFDDPARRRVKAEVARIDEAVRHHLARASAAGATGLNRRVAVAGTLAPVLDGLGRLAARRSITLDSDLPEGLCMHLDPQDLQELVGNLLENALHWARSRVLVSGGSDPYGTWLTIEDDGPGMSTDERRQSLSRGARLDELQPGSGLGLAIVNELVSLYGGRLRLEASPRGGLAAHVWLPDHVPTKA
ncbi:sensor histidine kinase [Halomonas nitroreducens]|uniref:histidine kinase n=1 Tax=Halomonas nitroreducens TaxID=447425 RepID=A0A431V6L7_9GAMM|nr:sensor histidine kinase [Halomonas nitroreducens]RTR06323.1 HAMP domain-containing histidine kinase [Halomonas nitroreducens]